MKKKILPFALFALVFAFIGFLLDQGIMYLLLSEVLLPAMPEVATFFSGIIPGLFLGIGISLAYNYTQKPIANERYNMFIFLAAIGTLAGYLLSDTLFRFNILNPEISRFLSTLLATYILLLGFHKSIFHLSQKQIFVPSLIGAIVAYLPFMVELPNLPFIFLVFLFYPVILASLLGWIVYKNKK